MPQRAAMTTVLLVSQELAPRHDALRALANDTRFVFSCHLNDLQRIVRAIHTDAIVVIGDESKVFSSKLQRLLADANVSYERVTVVNNVRDALVVIQRLP